MKTTLTLLAFIFLIGHAASGQTGQTDKSFTDADYQRAAAVLGSNANKLVDNAIRPVWLPDARLWYKTLTATKAEYKLFDPTDNKTLTTDSKKVLFEKGSVKPEPEARPQNSRVNRRTRASA